MYLALGGGRNVCRFIAGEHGGIVAQKHHFTRKGLQQKPTSPWGRSESSNIRKLLVCKALRRIAYFGLWQQSLCHGLFSKGGIEKMFELGGD